MTALNLILFFAFQVIAALLFKWSGSPSGHYWGGFVGGNLFGVTSIVMLINLYRVWPAGVVLGVATGGGFPSQSAGDVRRLPGIFDTGRLVWNRHDFGRNSAGVFCQIRWMSHHLTE